MAVTPGGTSACSRSHRDPPWGPIGIVNPEIFPQNRTVLQLNSEIHGARFTKFESGVSALFRLELRHFQML